MRRTRRCEPIKPDTVVIGVDVGKGAHVAVALSSTREESKPRKIPVTAQGFMVLEAFAVEWTHRFGATKWVAALEPTGHYGTTLVAWLSSKGVPVFSVQPSYTNRAKVLYDGTSRKTDAKDAAVIATLCHQGVCRPYRLASGAFAELRVLTGRRRQLAAQHCQIRNRIHGHMDVLFPELRKVFPWFEGSTVQWVLENTPTPIDVLKWQPEQLATTLARLSGGRLKLERANALIDAARISIGITEGLESHRLAVKQLATELRRVLEQLAEIERGMARVLQEIPYSSLLRTIPQMGTVTIATLLGELGDLKGYQHSNQLVAMAGLDLVENTSGERKGRHRISRRGRAYARQLLYLAALRLGWDVMSASRKRQVEDRKKHANKAAVANMDRLLRLMFAMVRDGRPFDPIQTRPMPQAA